MSCSSIVKSLLWRRETCAKKEKQDGLSRKELINKNKNLKNSSLEVVLYFLLLCLESLKRPNSSKVYWSLLTSMIVNGHDRKNANTTR